MTARGAGAVALAAVITLGGCGTTYVDESVATIDTSPDATTTTLTPVDPDASVDSLLTEIESLMRGLDERIIENDRQVETFERIDELWTAAERQIRGVDPNDLYNFEQAIALARTGVERRRPADASKGYKIINGVIDAYLDRT